jgi:hypothetical protein
LDGAFGTQATESVFCHEIRHLVHISPKIKVIKHYRGENNGLFMDYLWFSGGLKPLRSRRYLMKLLWD